MARLDSSDSEPEESENLSSEEEETEAPNIKSNGEKEHEISAYEKQRLSRIAENKARMEAMGLSKLASSLMGSPQNLSKCKGKRKVVEDDEDYRPNDEDEGEDEDEDGGGDDDDAEFLGNKASRSYKRKVILNLEKFCLEESKKLCFPTNGLQKVVFLVQFFIDFCCPLQTSIFEVKK